MYSTYVIVDLESLERYKSALGRHVQAQDELQEIISAQKQPEMVAKYKECQEAESQLLEIERQLGKCCLLLIVGVYFIFCECICRHCYCFHPLWL